MARKVPPPLRNLLANRTVTLIAALTALLTAALTAAAVSFLSEVTANAAARELSGRPGSVITVTAPVTRHDASRVRGALTGLVGRLLAGLRPRIEVSAQSDTLNLPGRPGPALARGRLQTQLVTLPAFAAHAGAVTGACPLTALGADELPVCVPKAVASELGVRPGMSRHRQGAGQRCPAAAGRRADRTARFADRPPDHEPDSRHRARARPDRDRGDA